GYACKFMIRERDGSEDVLARSGHENLAARCEESVEACPRIREQRHTACRGLKESSGGAEAILCHRAASDIKGCARRAEERRMQCRWQVPDEEDVFRPRKIIRVLCAADHKTLMAKLACRPDEELFQRGLTISSVGAQIAERRTKILLQTRRSMGLRIDPAVERSHSASPEPGLQLGECPTA